VYLVTWLSTISFQHFQIKKKLFIDLFWANQGFLRYFSDKNENIQAERSDYTVHTYSMFVCRYRYATEFTRVVLFQIKIWLKSSAEQQFLYGHHVMKAGLGRITENTDKYQVTFLLHWYSTVRIFYVFYSLREGAMFSNLCLFMCSWCFSISDIPVKIKIELKNFLFS
jgi:UPF0113 PUA domain